MRHTQLYCNGSEDGFTEKQSTRFLLCQRTWTLIKYERNRGVEYKHLELTQYVMGFLPKTMHVCLKHCIMVYVQKPMYYYSVV